MNGHEMLQLCYCNTNPKFPSGGNVNILLKWWQNFAQGLFLPHKLKLWNWKMYFAPEVWTHLNTNQNLNTEGIQPNTNLLCPPVSVERVLSGGGEYSGCPDFTKPQCLLPSRDARRLRAAGGQCVVRTETCVLVWSWGLSRCTCHVVSCNIWCITFTLLHWTQFTTSGHHYVRLVFCFHAMTWCTLCSKVIWHDVTIAGYHVAD